MNYANNLHRFWKEAFECYSAKLGNLFKQVLTQSADLNC